MLANLDIIETLVKTETMKSRTVVLMPPSKEDKPGKPTKRRMVKAGRKRGKGVIERNDVGGGEKEKEPRGIELNATD